MSSIDRACNELRLLAKKLGLCRIEVTVCVDGRVDIVGYNNNGYAETTLVADVYETSTLPLPSVSIERMNKP